MGRKHFVVLLLVLGIYLLLRLGWPGTIEFGYDQPILASLVSDFIKNPTFINSFKFVSFNPWGFPSWGPVQIFFWVPFLLISKNPLTISQLSAIFNLLGVVAVFLIGKRFFSVKIGILATLFLSVHPWSVIFSRMIYQPTPVLTLVPIAMFVSLYVFEKPKSKVIILMTVLWTFVTQFYLHVLSLAITTFVVMGIYWKKIHKTYLLLGIVFSIVLFLPYRSGTFDIRGVSSKFDELRVESPYSYKDVTYEFLGTLGGGRLSWQLGYGYKDFEKYLPVVSWAEAAGIVFVFFLTVYSLFKRRFLLVFWMVAPLWFLTAVKTPVALPRYFLVSLPALSILFAIFVIETVSKIGKISYFIPVVIFSWWIFLIFNYYSFIQNYSYDRGFLSNFSDVPYVFLDKSFKWIVNDASQKGFTQITVSDDFHKPFEFSLNQAQRYYWEYYLGRNQNAISTSGSGHYLMYFTPSEKGSPIYHAQFGPYVVYEVESRN